MISTTVGAGPLDVNRPRYVIHDLAMMVSTTTSRGWKDWPTVKVSVMASSARAMESGIGEEGG